MNALILLILGGSILTIGDIIFKFWSEKNQLSLYISGLFVYLIGLMFLVQSFKSQNIAVASAIFVIVNIVTLSIFSWIYFKESLSLLQIIGIIISFVAILFLELGGK